jgi:hypothetical protein
VITMIIIPEVTLIAAAIAMWRKRTAMSAGILLFAVTAAGHVLYFVATHH